jgi:hypothetical protein
VTSTKQTLHASEHFSVTERAEWRMAAFREAVDDCSLQDLSWHSLSNCGSNQDILSLQSFAWA